ncbi:MAG: HTTM domain-containing protein [Winogradskyella sp.]|uniref:HTTM domain-containing protein n=1 Tax=Winogradskyella sp. TaxID=1883156 RepID=UPI0018045521|nr:HTTM domain-containing protein [Winogradskyella sp.]MBT8244842.1 HTTM domain-containing protein [Winogradskyella sp.]NNK21800.1 HTTM domain-containing protein [Winogradskyella sp.]
MFKTITTYLKHPVKAAPLAVFRIIFGCLMLFSTLRFLSQNWVETYYINPTFHFKYFGFEFVKDFGAYTYILYAITLLASLGILLGYKYRLSTILFFLSFTYCELIDKTYYLNHYYFVSIIGFLLIFLPAHCFFSLDAKKQPKLAFTHLPRYNIFVIQLMLFIVYFYAGLAKINSDWLLRAMPLQVWLPSLYDLPLLGDLFQKQWMHYLMSWSGMLYDLCIPFLLFYKRTRLFAFIMVVVFHVLTRILFPIGIFPYVMILSTLIFFDAAFHEKIISILRRLFRIKDKPKKVSLEWIPNLKNTIITGLLVVFFTFQFLFPFRYLLYPDELFWTEEGYRYSWRVMLIEKGGYVQYKIVNPETKNWFYVDHSEFLTEYQEKQLRTQADFILQFATFLEGHFRTKGIKNPEVYVDSYISLNGRLSQRFIDPNIDLTKIKDSWKHKDWILPFNDNIYGF